MRVKVHYEIKCSLCNWPLMIRTVVPYEGSITSEYECRRCGFYKLVKGNAHIIVLKRRCVSWEALAQLYDSRVEEINNS